MIDRKTAYGRIASLLQRLDAGVGENLLSVADRASARAQIAEIAELLSGRDDPAALALVAGFRQLAARLDAQEAVQPIISEEVLSRSADRRAGAAARKGRQPVVRTAEGRRLTRDLRRVAAMVAAAATMTTASLSYSPVMAAVPVYQVDDKIVNPSTGVEETVAAVVNGGVVRTKEGHLIVIATTVGDTFQAGDFGTAQTVEATPDGPDPAPAANKTYTVSSQIITGGKLTGVKVKDSSNVEYTLNLVTQTTGQPADFDGGSVIGGGSTTRRPRATSGRCPSSRSATAAAAAATAAACASALASWAA